MASICNVMLVLAAANRKIQLKNVTTKSPTPQCNQKRNQRLRKKLRVSCRLLKNL